MNLDPSVLEYVSYWMLFGLVHYAFITRGFRRTLKMKLEEE